MTLNTTGKCQNFICSANDFIVHVCLALIKWVVNSPITKDKSTACII